jgi:hypothetical protein
MRTQKNAPTIRLLDAVAGLRQTYVPWDNPLQPNYIISTLIALDHNASVVFSRTAGKDARMEVSVRNGETVRPILPVMRCASWDDDIRASKSLVYNARMEAPVIDLCVLTTISLAIDHVQDTQAMVLLLEQLSDFKAQFAKLHPDGVLMTLEEMQNDAEYLQGVQSLASDAVKMLVAAMRNTLLCEETEETVCLDEAMALERLVMLNSTSGLDGSHLFSVWIASAEENSAVRVLDHASALHENDVVGDAALKVLVRVFRYMLCDRTIMKRMIDAAAAADNDDGGGGGGDPEAWTTCAEMCLSDESATASEVECRAPSSKCEQLNASNCIKSGIFAIFDATAAAAGSKTLAHTSTMDSPMFNAFLARVVSINSVVPLGQLTVAQLRTEEPNEIRNEILAALQLLPEDTDVPETHDDENADDSSDEVQSSVGQASGSADERLLPVDTDMTDANDAEPDASSDEMLSNGGQASSSADDNAQHSVRSGHGRMYAPAPKEKRKRGDGRVDVPTENEKKKRRLTDQTHTKSGNGRIDATAPSRKKKKMQTDQIPAKDGDVRMDATAPRSKKKRKGQTDQDPAEGGVAVTPELREDSQKKKRKRKRSRKNKNKNTGTGPAKD